MAKYILIMIIVGLVIFAGFEVFQTLSNIMTAYANNYTNINF